MSKNPEKTKEQILAERQAKKAAKQLKRKDEKEASKTVQEQPAKQVVDKSTPETSEMKSPPAAAVEPAKSNKKDSKKKKDQPAPSEAPPSGVTDSPQKDAPAEVAKNLEQLTINDPSSKPKTLSKAERRAIQEAQRAAKAKAAEEKKISQTTPTTTVTKKKKESPATESTATVKSSPATKAVSLHKVKLFKHLYSNKCEFNINIDNKLHPSIVKLGLQYARDSIVGSNARCYAFLNAMKVLIHDYVTPKEKDFSRGLEAEIQNATEYLQNCRPLAVSMINALKFIKLLVSQENSNDSDDDKKQRLIEKIETYASEQIETAAIAISLKVREKINNGDVILTYGCSSLIKRTLVEAYRDAELKFRVIVVDSRPDHEGQEMLKALTMLGISCTYVMINSISFIMPEVTKVLLGAHALLANGYVYSRVGTAQIALIANSCNVPVLVCCETHKFSEKVQTDAFVFNELGDPNALVKNKNTGESFEHLKDWESLPHLTPLNLRYDITPPELISAVVTEIAILPCTSVQVILRVKPSE